MSSVIYHNAQIHTMDPSLPVVSAMEVEDGRIVNVGDLESLGSKGNSRLVDLRNGTVLPGFNDAHIHVWKVGQLESFIIDLRGVGSIAELQHIVAAAAKKLPTSTWIVGRGFNEQRLKEGRMPDKNDLDQISRRHPIYLIRTCAHIAAVNSLALQKAEINSRSLPPPGGVIGKTQDGNPNGLFYETALGLITKHIPPPSLDDYRKMIELGARKMLQVGITSATDPAVHPDLLAAYKKRHERGQDSIRFNLMPILLPDGGDKPFPVPEKYQSDLLHVHTVKFFSDGGLSGRTAALKRPYKNSDDSGVLRLESDQFYQLADEAQAKGFRIATHSIGDRAIDLVLDVYKQLHSKFGDTRNRIEHFGLPSPANIRTVAEYGFVAVPQPIFLDELGENFLSSLDNEYLSFCYPIRSLLDQKINVALSTDAPVVKNINPLSCIKTAVTRRTSGGHIISSSESITVLEAIHAYTMGSAYAEGSEKTKGSLTPGKVADFIVLDGNPLEAAVDDIDSIHVEETYVGGICRYNKAQGFSF